MSFVNNRNKSNRSDAGTGASASERGASERFIERLVYANRVTKVTSGGKRFSVSTGVVVGDGKGRVGFGPGKAKETPDSAKKAATAAKRDMIRVSINEEGSLHHDIAYRKGGARVYLRSARKGAGVIAGGSTRSICYAAGIDNVVAKSLGSRNPRSVVRAVLGALKNCQSPRYVANRRGKKVSEIIGKKSRAAA